METKKYIGEIWKPIRGYVGLYEVSNYGRIKSLTRFKKSSHGSVSKVEGRILNLSTSKYSYKQITLHDENGKMKSWRVHRLVAEAFIPNPYNLPQINHKDSNPANNVVSNLEWCDAKYNNSRQHRLDALGKAVGYVGKNNLICCYISVKEAAEDTGCCNTAIIDCCKGRINTSRGKKWVYIGI